MAWPEGAPMTVGRPDPDDYTRFLRGALSALENRRIVRQLLASCQLGCGEVCQASTVVGMHPPLAARAQEILAERRRLPGLLEILRDLPQAARRPRLTADAAFHLWPLAERLIDDSRDLLDSDPVSAAELASDA